MVTTQTLELALQHATLTPTQIMTDLQVALAQYITETLAIGATPFDPLTTPHATLDELAHRDVLSKPVIELVGWQPVHADFGGAGM